MPSLKEMHLDLELIFFAGGTSPVLAVVLHEGLAPAVADLLPESSVPTGGIAPDESTGNNDNWIDDLFRDA